MLESINWLQVVPALLGGGLASAVLKIAWDEYSGRIQTIGYRVDLEPVFSYEHDDEEIQATVTLVQADKINEFRNLFVAEVQVINRGRVDFAEFPLGLSLGLGTRCAYIATKGLDRQHRAEVQTAISPDSPVEGVDLLLKPFNRKDSYSLKLYIALDEQRAEPGEILPSSSAPVKFMQMPKASEVLTEIVTSTSLKVGSVRLTLYDSGTGKKSRKFDPKL